MNPWNLADLAPAVWVALVVGLLLAALARWYDRVPLRVAAVFAVAIGLLYGEVLAGGAVLLPLDNLRGHAPFRELAPAEPHGNLLQGDLLYLVHPARREARRAAAAGEWPLWSPRIGGGLPLLADPQAQVLQPVMLLGEGPLSPTEGPGAVAALRTALALIFSFLLIRRLGAGRGPALAGALAFGLGGFLQLWLGWPLANTAALLPAVLYALILTSERAFRRDWCLLTFALAALLAAGHPETILYALIVVGAFAAARWWQMVRGRAAWAGGSAASFLLALALVAPALLPFGEVLPHTLRWERMRDADEAEHAAPEDLEDEPGPVWGDGAAAGRPDRRPASRLVQAAAPNAFGNSRFVHYWGLHNSNEDAAGFVGTATLLAALLAVPLVLLGRTGRRRATEPPVRHELLALGLVAGSSLLMALPAEWAARLPGVGPETGAPGRLALVLDLGLALLAAAALERFRRGSEAVLPSWLRWLGPPALALALVGFHLWAYQAHALPSAPETLDLLRRGWVHWHLRFALLTAVLLVAGGGRRWMAPTLALLVAAELILAHGPANPPAPARLAFPETRAIHALRREAMPPGIDRRAVRVAGVGRTLLPNLAAVYGLADVRVFSPMAPARYLRLLDPAIDRWYGEVPLLGGLAHPALYDRLGVGWITATPEEGCPEGTRPGAEGPDALICRRPSMRPALTVSGTTPHALRIDAGGAHWEAALDPQPQDEEPATRRVETGIPRLPGWRVLAAGPDRTPADRVAAAAGALVEAELPADTRRIHLLYRPAGFVGGLLAAAAGLALFAAWLLPPPR